MEAQKLLMVKKEQAETAKTYNPKLEAMIHVFDYTPVPELELDANDYMQIYNWLKELQLYHKLCGPLNKL